MHINSDSGALQRFCHKLNIRRDELQEPYLISRKDWEGAASQASGQMFCTRTFPNAASTAQDFICEGF